MCDLFFASSGKFQQTSLRTDSNLDSTGLGLNLVNVVMEDVVETPIVICE